MTLFRKQRPKPDAAKLRRAVPHLETLENRTLLTVFSVGQVPSTYTLEQATANVQVVQDQGPKADVTVGAAAHPVGMGYQSGYFNTDGQNDLFRIDTAPSPGQQLGQPIKIALSYTWTAALQTYEGSDTPPWSSMITSSASVVVGDSNQQLFLDNLSTTFTLAQQDGWSDRLVIRTTVGESVWIAVDLNGEAHAAEPHYQTWVDFRAEFTVQDAGKGAVLLRNSRAALTTLAAAARAADDVFAHHRNEWSRVDGV